MELAKRLNLTEMFMRCLGTAAQVPSRRHDPLTPHKPFASTTPRQHDPSRHDRNSLTLTREVHSPSRARARAAAQGTRTHDPMPSKLCCRISCLIWHATLPTNGR